MDANDKRLSFSLLQVKNMLQTYILTPVKLASEIITNLTINIFYKKGNSNEKSKFFK